MGQGWRSWAGLELGSLEGKSGAWVRRWAGLVLWSTVASLAPGSVGAGPVPDPTLGLGCMWESLDPGSLMANQVFGDHWGGPDGLVHEGQPGAGVSLEPGAMIAGLDAAGLGLALSKARGQTLSELSWRLGPCGSSVCIS